MTCKRITTWLLLLAAGCTSSVMPPSAADAGQDAGASTLDCVVPDEGLPVDVFCTGLYVRQDSNMHAPDARPYTPGVTLWSDGAVKHRFLYLPPGAQIDNSDNDAWKFPVGTKAWKEFRVDGKLVETRLFWKRGEATWASGTYIWDSTTTSASLNTARKGVLLDSGYEIPTAKDCGKCHHGGSDNLLGIEAVALALPAANGVTLASLVASSALSAPPAVTQVSLPEDSSGKAAAALGFLHANCGMPCHSSRGLGEETQLLLRVRADELWPVTVPLAATDIYNATLGVTPSTASVVQKFPGMPRILPGSHDNSVIWLLASRRGDYQMPPLVSHQVDPDGTQQLADWIDSLPH